jgi:hypothetical protein
MGADYRYIPDVLFLLYLPYGCPENQNKKCRFGVLTAMFMKSPTFYDVTPLNPLKIKACLGELGD